jgi:serine/threonine protein kinase
MSDRILSNRYKLESELGRGGMGVVYRAQDTQVKRTVAIKTLPAIMTHNPDLMRRFQAEVQHASKLEHPNIVRVYDVGEDDGTHYYVMQYIEGSDLRAELKQRGRYTVEAALAVISQLAEALDYAHSQGIVHRDIKPENILLDAEGQAHIVDFGIAKAVEGTRMTRGLLGTPEYMSPEQVKGNRVDGRSDQYSLAVLSYELLTGRTPFPTQGDDPWAQINMHLNTPPPNPRTTVPDLPAHVANALLQALAKDPGQRFGSCGKFVKALRGEIKARALNDALTKNKRLSKSLGSVAVLSMVIIGILLIWHYSLFSRAFIKLDHAVKQKTDLQIVYVDYSQKMSSLLSSSIDGTARSRICWLGKLDRVDFDGNGKELIPYISGTDQIIFNNKIINVGESTMANSMVNSDVDKWNHGLIFAISTDGTKALYEGEYSSGEHDTLYIRNLLDQSSTIVGKMKTEFWGPGLFDKYPCSIGFKGGGSIMFWPTLSKSGNFVIFRNDNGEICLYNTASKGTSVIGQTGPYGPPAQFSPDEKTIAYSDGKKISVVNTDGTNSSTIASLDESEGYIEYLSFNGEMIAYLINPHKAFDVDGTVYLMKIKTIGDPKTKLILKSTSPLRCPALSPDGKNLAYCRLSSSGYYHVFVRSLDDEKEVDLGRGITPTWIISKLPLSKGQCGIYTVPFHLPEDYEMESNISADFDGDGSNETAYCGIALNKRPIIWIEKNGQSIWQFDFDGKDDLMGDWKPYFPQVFTAYDVIGDGIPELCCYFVSYSPDTASQDHLLMLFGYRDKIYNNLIEKPASDVNEVMVCHKDKRTPISIAVEDQSVVNGILINAYDIFEWDGCEFRKNDNLRMGVENTYNASQNAVLNLKSQGYVEVGKFFGK